VTGTGNEEVGQSYVKAIRYNPVNCLRLFSKSRVCSLTAPPPRSNHRVANSHPLLPRHSGHGHCEYTLPWELTTHQVWKWQLVPAAACGLLGLGGYSLSRLQVATAPFSAPAAVNLSTIWAVGNIKPWRCLCLQSIVDWQGGGCRWKVNDTGTG
jgi:hypothetical protein